MVTSNHFILIIFAVLAFQFDKVLSKKSSDSFHHSPGNSSFERTETDKNTDHENGMKWVDHRCPRYLFSRNGTCKDVVGNRRILKTEKSQRFAEASLSQSIDQLEFLMKLAKFQTIKEIIYFAQVSGITLSKSFLQVLRELKRHPEQMTECLKKGRWMFCNLYFPKCEIKGGFASKIPICQDICVNIETRICAKSFQLLKLVKGERSFDMPNCSSLPKQSLNRAHNCLTLNMTEPKAIETIKNTLPMKTSHFVVSTPTSFVSSSVVTSSIPSTLKMSSLETLSTARSTPSSAILSTKNTVRRTQLKHHSTRIIHLMTSLWAAPTSNRLIISTSERIYSTVRNTKINMHTDTTFATITTAKISSLVLSVNINKVDHDDRHKRTLAKRRRIIIISVASSVAVLIIVVIFIVFKQRRKVCRKNKNQDVIDDVEDETPYYATNFDNDDVIRRIMTSTQNDEESDEDVSLEMEDEKPFVDYSNRPEIDCIL